MPTSKEPTWDNTAPTWEGTSPVKQQAAAPTWDNTWEETDPAEQPSAYQAATSVRRTEKGGAIASEQVTDEELRDIAQQTGTDPKVLKEYVPYFGVLNKDSGFTDALKAIGGQAGRMAFNIPQKLFKMAQDDKYERALDIVDALAGQKQSYLLDVAGILGGPAGATTKVIKTAKEAKAVETLSKAAPIIKKGTVAAGTMGGVAGFGKSEQGNELRDAAIGAPFGATLAVTIPMAARGLKSVAGWSGDKLKKGLELIKANSANIEEAYQKAHPERMLEIAAVKEASNLDLRDVNNFVKEISDDLASRLVSPELRTLALKEGTKENKLLLSSLEKIKGGRELVSMAEPDLVKQLAYLKMKNVSKDLKRVFGESLTSLVKSRNKQDVSNLLDGLDKANFALQAVSGKGFEKSFNPLERMGYKIMSYVSDSKPFLQVLDDRYGTNFELIADNASKKLNLIYGAGVRKWAPHINAMAQANKDPKRFQELIVEIESGNPVSPEAQKIARFFKVVKNNANKMGANIQTLEGKGYFPKIRKSPADYIRSYRQEAERLQQDIDFSDFNDKSLNKLMKENPDFNSFVKETIRTSGLDDINALNFKQGFQILNNDIAKTRQALNLKAFATQQRSDTELPLWARELDPAKAASRWVSNTYKFLALKDEIAELNIASQIAKKANDKVAEEYLTNLKHDWMGGRIDTLASWGRKQAEKWEINLANASEKARASGNPIMANIYDGAKHIPDFFIKGQNNVYNNALGLSSKAALQNIASFYTQNFPELGNATSIYYAGKALPKLGQLLRKGQLGEYVFNKGLIDRDWTGEAQNVLSGELRKGLARQLGSKAAEKYSNTVMAMFKGSELLSRAMTGLIAEEVGQDILTKPELRNKLLINMKSSAYRRAFQGALEQRNQEAIKNILTSYLNSNNMYNYNKINQAEFARSLGPMFSIFSKWPSMAIGSQMKEFLNGGGFTPAVIRNMRMLYLPYATMYLADKVADATIKPFVGDQRYEATFGKKGLHGMMLTDATPTGVFERGGILASPAVRTAQAVAQSMFSDEEFGSRFNTAFKQLGMTYLPVLPLVDRLLERDLPRFINNQEPSKGK